MKAHEYYTRQSTMTDPKEYGYLFDDLPRNVGKLKEILQGLIMHFWDGELLNYKITVKRLLEIETRYVSKMLEKLMALDSDLLLGYRPPAKRIVGSCRDFGTLFCSMLRHLGIPTRTRVAFSAFYFKEYFHDEVVIEYWNQNLNKWCIVDPRTTEPHIKRQKLNITFDLLDVPRDMLIVAGLAWKMSRNNTEVADKFCGGDPNKYKGLWYVRDRLIQDLAALNKVEMQLWDCWGMMFRDHDILADNEQLELLDYLAELTLDPDKNLLEIQNIYQNNSGLRVPKKITSYSPVYRCREIEVITNQS